MSLKITSIEPTDQSLSCHGGLFLLERLIDQLGWEKRLRRLLPKKKRNKGPKQLEKLRSLLFSFCLGGDSLSDIDAFNKDELFDEVTGSVASRTMGDFLRSFGNRHVERLQEKLTELALELRTMLFPGDKKFVLSMDSTPHEHYGQKMEGLDWNYKNQWCLDSQNAYDQYGLSYLFDLRPGNTFSGKESERWVHHIFSRVPECLERYFRADSAYSKHAVLKALVAANAKFTIVLKQNVAKYLRAKTQLEWKETEIEFFGGKGCEVCESEYPVKSLGNFRVVMIRKRLPEVQLDFLKEDQDEYKHYAIVTNIPMSEMDPDQIIEFYQKRANCENYIKEQKYGFDFLNFPCKSFTANRTFGVIGTFAHNLMRVLSLKMVQKVKRVIDKKTDTIKTVTQLGYFSKAIRNTLLRIPCQLVRGSRRIKLRMSRNNREVLSRVYEKFKSLQLGETVPVT